MYRFFNQTLDALLTWTTNQDIRNSARRMDPITRNALARNVAQETATANHRHHDEDDDEGGGDDHSDEYGNPAATSVDDEIRAIEREMAQVQESLSNALEKERFLALRHRKYRNALDEQARALRQERRAIQQHEQEEFEQETQGQGREDAVETGQERRERIRVRKEALERRTEQWDREEDLLQTVAEKQREILLSCEEMRRTLQQMDIKRRTALRYKDECQRFVQVAAEQAQSEEEQAAAVAGDGEHEEQDHLVLDVELSRMESPPSSHRS